MMVRRKHIREVIDRLLTECGIDKPPVDVRQIATHLGLSIREVPAETEMSGFLVRMPGAEGTAVIGLNKTHSEHRKRFTIGHELAHFCLHAAEEIHVDDGFLVYRRDQKSAEGNDRTEIEANVFAAELLMPFMFLQEDLKKREAIDLSDEEELQQLAKRYQVSPQAMTFRLANLGWITL